MNNILKSIVLGYFELIKKRLRKVRDEKSYRLYPNNPKHSDIYLVEFPKSGVTWLATLIANINLLESNEKVQATFYNLHQYIPDIHKSRDLIDKPLWNFPKYRFIKSHDTYNKNYNFVIYLIRDPYKVMNSYYIFCKQLGWYDKTFKEFVEDPVFGIKSWVHHTNSWLDRKVSAQRIHFLKYEDLIDDPFLTINNLYTNLGLLVDDKNINKAISLSNIENMKKTEKFYNINSSASTEFEFVDKSKNFFEENMNEDIKSYIYDNVKNSKIYNKYYEKLV